MNEELGGQVKGLQAASLFSGAAALIAETLWVRSFSAMLGATVEAAAATFSAFLVGLAVGAYLAGRVSDRLERPALTYVAAAATSLMYLAYWLMRILDAQRRD